jgi:putative endonuclease
MNNTPWYVYIIQNEKGHYYTGITTDLERRFKEHASSRKGAKFFNTGAPVDMVFSKRFANRSLASKFECAVKKLSRSQKIALITKKKIAC